MKKLLLVVLCVSSNLVISQTFTSYFTGDITDVATNHETGVCLMGGATENDNAMIWFLSRADGGDVLVLRTSGSDGYNDYFFSELGVTVNSVETIVINNAGGAIDPYVLSQVENAEAIWFAGGNQYDYVSYFKDTAMEDALNQFINGKKGVIGGTSAGMAILGEHYFDAANGTISTDEARVNPYDSRVSLGHSDFLSIPYLENIITDTHFDNPDRRGRLVTFMARMVTDRNVRALGLGCEEYTAICIDAEGDALAFGSYPEEEDYVYFVQPGGCLDYEPLICKPNVWLGWEGFGLQVLKVPATNAGTLVMNMENWAPVDAFDSWERWDYLNDVLALYVEEEAGFDPSCYLLGIEDIDAFNLTMFPNPSLNSFQVNGISDGKLEVYSASGNLMKTVSHYDGRLISSENFATGLYFVKVSEGPNETILRLIKE